MAGSLWLGSYQEGPARPSGEWLALVQRSDPSQVPDPEVLGWSHGEVVHSTPILTLEAPKPPVDTGGFLISDPNPCLRTSASAREGWTRLDPGATLDPLLWHERLTLRPAPKILTRPKPPDILQGLRRKAW